MNKIIITLNIFLFSLLQLHAQSDTISKNADWEQRFEKSQIVINRLKKLTITGHFQGQYIYAQPDAVLRIGAPNENPSNNFSRIGIRQGRIRTMFEEGITSAVFQLDMSERGVIIVDAFAQVRDPWMKTNYLRGGLFFRQFGHEVRYPTARRETPERSRIITTLFPSARDLGGVLHLQAPATSPWSIFELDLSMVAGNAINSEVDSRRDFIGSLGFKPSLGKELDLRIGASYYGGFVFQGTPNVYRMSGNGFVRDAALENIGGYVRRKYVGFDLQATHMTSWGRSQCKFEYIQGQQPGSISSSISPNFPIRPNYDTYIRNFRGGYVTFLQDLGKIPFTAYTRFDWYDPNTKVAGNDIGLNNTTMADIAYNSLGFGLMWRVNKDLELNGYYEITKNETTENISEFRADLKDNIFYMTLMYRY